MYVGLQALRAKIRGFQSAGESIHHRIGKAKGWKRHKLWSEKRQLGRYNRDHLIAYGLLRGLTYERIERCAEENRPDAARIFAIVQAHGNWEAAKKWATVQTVEAALKRASS